MAIRFSITKDRLGAFRKAVREFNAETVSLNRRLKKKLYRKVSMRIPKLQTIGIPFSNGKELISVEISIADRTKVLWQHLSGIITKFGV